MTEQLDWRGRFPEAASVTYSAETLARQAFLADTATAGLARYSSASTHEGVQLRPHQTPVLEVFSDFLRTNRDTADRRILWPASPSSGKSMVAGLIMREAGIGRPGPGERPMKALAIVPRDVARRQILEDCAARLPNARIAPIMPSDPPEKIDALDGWVMSYKGLHTMPEDTFAHMLAQTDLLLPDEVHGGLGEKISARLKHAMRMYGPTTVALSATPDYNENHTTRNVLGISHMLPAMSPREAAETGVTNGVHLLAVSTDRTIRLLRKEGEEEKPTDWLIGDSGRNGLIVDIMRSMARSRRQGLVACAPGGENLHAQTIAEMAREATICDPETGQSRHLRVESVGNHQTDTYNRRIIAEYKAGEHDALAFSRYLFEAFDYNGVRYIVMACHSTSQVYVGQLMGRGGRLGPDKRATKIFYLADKITGRVTRKLWTPFDIFDATQGEHIGGGIEDDPVFTDRKKTDTPRSNQNSGRLSDGLYGRIAAIPPGTFVQSELVVRNVLPEPPPTYQVMAQVEAIAEGHVSMEGADYRLRGRLGDDGQPLMVSAIDEWGRIRRYVSPRAAELINSRYIFAQKIARADIDHFLASQGWPVMSFDMLKTVCALAEVSYSVEKKAVRFQSDDARKFLLALARVPFADPEAEVHISQLGQTIGVGTKQFYRSIEGGLRQQVVARRRGMVYRSYHPVGVLSTLHAIKAVGVAAQFSQLARRTIGSRTAEEVVSDAQAAYKQWAAGRPGFQPQLRKDRILAFLEQVLPPEQTSLATDLSSATPKEPARKLPQLIDPTLRLSGDPDWRKRANCSMSNANLFLETDEVSISKALAICRPCPVKADCLLQSIRDKSSGTAGGLRESHRRRLARRVSLENLEARLKVLSITNPDDATPPRTQDQD